MASPEAQAETHSFYQGLLLSIGNLRGYWTYSPQQDKNKLYVDRPLRDVRTLQVIPAFSHGTLVKRSETVDVIWFNERLMPYSFFEVEHSTEMQNSLAKFCDLQDFSARMVIVADSNRRAEFEHKIRYKAFEPVGNRVKFLDYESAAKQYEIEVMRASQPDLL